MRIFDPEALSRALEWAYQRALQGVPGLETAPELAAEYGRRPGSIDSQARALVRAQVVKAGTSGLITGIGGLSLLPVTVPASLLSVLYIQLRMVAALACMGGHEVRDDRVRTMAYVCLAADAVRELAKETGAWAAKDLARRLLEQKTVRLLGSADRTVGLRLASRMGQRNVATLGRWVPLAGGLVGAAVDATSTLAIGKAARRVFLGLP
jgi:hypothetical protein